ncbi:MAG TPA: hypothetical protein VOA41_20895 [Candidatus Dormibacteraeota bacterium]|nr:hypothetical protein [Candidatus Dormibacteraeota bacterium]
MPKLRTKPDSTTGIPSPIQISIDKIQFNKTVFGDIFSAVVWPESVDDQLFVDFTVKNKSADVSVPFSVVTGDVFDGDVTVMSSGYGQLEFFQFSSTIDSPIGPGESAVGTVKLKWDANWKPNEAGYCYLGLTYWEKTQESRAGDRTYDVGNPDYDPKAPQTLKDENGMIAKNPKARPRIPAFFRTVGTAAVMINISRPPCLQQRLGAKPDKEDSVSWENWTTTFGFVAARVYRPKTAAEIARAILDAEDANVPLRAVGAAWSLSDATLPLLSQANVKDARLPLPIVTQGPPPTVIPAIPADYNGAYVIDTTFLASSLQDRLAEIVDPDVVEHGLLVNEQKDGPKYLFHVQAGIKNADLATLLDHQLPRLALQTSGGSDGATIAGALSTGTHGADWDKAPPVDAVRAIHLIGPGAKEYWIEPSSKTITTPERVHAVYPCIDLNRVIYDDTVFYAVLVSMGCMGVIYSLVLEAVPQYGVQEATAITNWHLLKMQGGVPPGDALANPLSPGQATTLLDVLKVGSIFDLFIDGTGALPKGAPNYFIKVSFNPWPNGAGEGNFDCWVTHRAKVDVPLPKDSTCGGAGGLPSITLGVLKNTIQAAVGADLDKGIRLNNFSNSLVRADGSLPSISDTALLMLDFAKFWKYDFVPRVVNRTVLDLLQRGHAPNGQPLPDSAPQTQICRNVSYRIGAGIWGPGDSLPGRAIEVAFPCPDGLVFLDEQVLPLFKALGGAGQYVLGYIAVRICGKTRALFGMQQWDPTCLIEVVLLASEDAPSIINTIQQRALSYNPPGLLHWGLENDLVDVVAQGKPQPFVTNGAYAAWKAARVRLGHPPSSLFNNNLSRRLGLSVP